MVYYNQNNLWSVEFKMYDCMSMIRGECCGV